MPRIIRLADLEQFAAVNFRSDPGDPGGPVIIPSTAQIVIYWGLTNGSVGHNVMYQQYSGPFAATVTQANSIKAALVAGATWTALAAHLAVGASIQKVSIRNVAIPNEPLIESNSAATPGTSSGTALPDETAACITLRTAKAGVAFRGRVFIPGWATTALGTGGVIAPAALTALQNWAAGNLSTALNTGGVAVLGQKARVAYVGSSGTQHPAREPAAIPLTGLVVRDNHWDTIRKRGLA